jgi:hypothetical protein
MAEEKQQQESAGGLAAPPGPFAALGIPILPEEKSAYFNGFAIGVTGGDIVFTLMRNGVPTLTVNASFTVAKTFGESIVASVKKLEEATEHTIMTVPEVMKATAGMKMNPPKNETR